MKSKNIILLHGFCESKEMWADFEEQLSEKYNVYCLDLPGFGEFYLDVTGLSIAEMAEIVQNQINVLALDSYIIVGHSLGGYIGLEIAKQFPNKLIGLGLFHSTVFPDTEERKEKRNDVIRFIEKHGADVFAKSFIPQLFYPSKREECKHDINKLVEIASGTSTTTMIEVTKAMQSRNGNVNLLKELKIPVLFIVGKQDQSVTLESSLKQVFLPQDVLSQILDNCGHMGMYEQKRKTMLQIEHFVEYCIC